MALKSESPIHFGTSHIYTGFVPPACRVHQVSFYTTVGVVVLLKDKLD
jgi:hypothetical protein